MAGYANLTGACFDGARQGRANLVKADSSGATVVNSKHDLAGLRKASGFVPSAAIGTSLRGTILRDGTVNAFVLNPGETWRVRPNAVAVTLDGPPTMSANSTIEIAGSAVQQKAGAALTLTVPNHAHLIIRDGGSLTCDKVIIAPGGQLDGDGTINAAIVTDGAIPKTIHKGTP